LCRRNRVQRQLYSCQHNRKDWKKASSTCLFIQAFAWMACKASTKRPIKGVPLALSYLKTKKSIVQVSQKDTKTLCKRCWSQKKSMELFDSAHSAYDACKKNSQTRPFVYLVTGLKAQECLQGMFIYPARTLKMRC